MYHEQTFTNTTIYLFVSRTKFLFGLVSQENTQRSLILIRIDLFTIRRHTKMLSERMRVKSMSRATRAHIRIYEAALISMPICRTRRSWGLTNPHIRVEGIDAGVKSESSVETSFTSDLSVIIFLNK